MPEVAKLLVASKIINKIGKCANEDFPHLSQIYIIRYDGKVMICALNGFALAMRKADFIEDDMSGTDINEARENYEKALFAIGRDSWMFPADLKIPNGLNVDITLYEDGTTVLQAKQKNAIYGPFERVPMISGTEIDIHNIFRYPSESPGCSRAINPALFLILIAAISEKRERLIINASGDYDQAIYCKIDTGDAYGMLLPIREETLADQSAGKDGEDGESEE